MDVAELERLAKNYRPNAKVRQHLDKLTLVMTLGPSGVGKTTLMRASGIPMVIGDASREPRAHEQDGVDYWFRSFDDMAADAKNGEYLQIIVGPEGDLKGTRDSSFPPQGIATFAVVAAAIADFRKYGFADTKTAVIVPPSFDEWMHRLGGHGIDDEKVRRRLQEARPSYTFALQDEQAQFVLNDSIEAGARRLQQVAADEVPDQHDQARDIVAELLQRLPA